MIDNFLNALIDLLLDINESETKEDSQVGEESF